MDLQVVLPASPRMSQRTQGDTISVETRAAKTTKPRVCQRSWVLADSTRANGQALQPPVAGSGPTCWVPTFIHIVPRPLTRL